MRNAIAGAIRLARDAGKMALLDVRVTVQPEGYHITGMLRELEIPAEPGPTETKVLHSHGAARPSWVTPPCRL